MRNIVQRFSHSIVGCRFPCLCFGKGRLVVLKNETDRTYRGKRPQNHYGHNRPPFFTLSVRPAMCRSRRPKCGLQFSKHVVLLKIPLKFFTILHLPGLFGREKGSHFHIWPQQYYLQHSQQAGKPLEYNRWALIESGLHARYETLQISTVLHRQRFSL